MLRKLRKNDGVVFVIVLSVIITMMVLVVSIISMNLNQAVTSEKEVKRIKAEQMMYGSMAFFFANQLSDSPGNIISHTEPLDSVDYTADAELTLGRSPD